MHPDEHDCPGAFTSLTWFNSAPTDSYTTGDLFFPEIGAYASMAGVGVLNFCGLHLHGGRPPVPKTSDAELDQPLYCFVTIHYSHKTTFREGNASSWPEALVMSQFYFDSNSASKYNPSSSTQHSSIISCPSILKE